MAKRTHRRVMNEVDKRPASSHRAEEFIIANSGRRPIKEVEVGGKKIDLFSSGATTYDKTLAAEVKDKYKDDPNIVVINKPHVRPNGARKTHFTVPEGPWSKDKDEDD